MDFEELLKRWQVAESVPESPLRDYDAFRFASVSEGRTLQWVNVPMRHRAPDEEENASETESPLAFDPDLPYAKSAPLEEFRLVRTTAWEAA